MFLLCTSDCPSVVCTLYVHRYTRLQRYQICSYVNNTCETFDDVFHGVLHNCDTPFGFHDRFTGYGPLYSIVNKLCKLFFFLSYTSPYRNVIQTLHFVKPRCHLVHLVACTGASTSRRSLYNTGAEGTSRRT